MAQLTFFDADKRLAALSKQGDPLEAIARLVPWEEFRCEIEAVVLTAEVDKKSTAGRKPIDALVMFRMLVLQSLYNLSDAQAEYQARDRLSFTRFLALGIEDRIADGTTLWLFREKLAKAGLIEKLFAQFGRHLEAKGYIARGGQMVDATIVPVPRQRNSGEDNEAVKAGKTPQDWEKKPAKNRQKDKDARWTKKHSKSFFGYKNHINADAKHKLIRRYDVSDASVHDSQKLDGLLNKSNTSEDVYADSAYRSAETEAKLKARGFRSRIHRRGSRNHPLSDAQAAANRRKSRVRVRVEHIFGAQENTPGGRIVRTIGIIRAKAKIGLQNLAYNIRRLVVLERITAA
jgi:transposase, IS5 family